MSPEWTFREVVGATGFEPATPCAQGKLGRAAEVLLAERLAALAICCDQIWDQSSGEGERLTAMPRDSCPAGSPPTRWCLPVTNVPHERVAEARQAMTRDERAP